MADSVFNLFHVGDRDLAKKAQKDIKDGAHENDEKLSKDSLDEIDKKYKDKLKKEV